MTKEAEQPTFEGALAGMHNLRERVAKLQPRVREWQQAVREWEREEEGAAWLLIVAAWPGLRAIATVDQVAWMPPSPALVSAGCDSERTYLCDESEPCFRVEENGRTPYFVRGEKSISAMLDECGGVHEVAMEIERHLSRWERETEDDDCADCWRTQTAALRELRAALTKYDHVVSVKHAAE